MRHRSFTFRSPLAQLAIALAIALGLSACSGGTDDSSGSSAAGSRDAAATTEAVRSGEFTLLTYNVAGLPEPLSSSEPSTNTPLIGPLLNSYDLVLLQETWKTPDPNPLAPLRAYHEELEATVDFPHRSASAPLPLGSDPTRPDALLSDGLNLFSRFPFGDVTRVSWTGCFGGMDTSDGGAGDCLATKGFSVTTTQLDDGVQVDVYDLHGEAGASARDQELQAADYDQLATFIDEHSAGRAVLLAGDTNLHTDVTTDPDHPEGAGDLAIWERFLERTGLVDVCEPLECDDADRIDKVAFRSDGGIELEPISRSWETATFVRADGQPLSDHDPLAVRFRWSAAV